MASSELCKCGRWLVKRGDGKLVCPGRHFYPKRDESQDSPEPTEDELDAGEATE